MPLNEAALGVSATGPLPLLAALGFGFSGDHKRYSRETQRDRVGTSSETAPGWTESLS